MKKVIAGLLAFVLLLSGLPTQIAHASAGEELLEVISYADGSYLEITLETLPQARASGSITKAKNYIFNSTEGVPQWKITLTGSFTYTGTGSTGHTAYGSARMVKKYLGAITIDKTYNLSLTCDTNGNVS